MHGEMGGASSYSVLHTDAMPHFQERIDAEAVKGIKNNFYSW